MSSGFDAQLFEQIRSDETIETTLRELKGRIYRLNVPQEKAEFVRDAVAMGNAVRRMGKTGFILFGYTELLEVIDQASEYLGSGEPPASLAERMDRNGRILLQCLDDHVSPHMAVEFHWGHIQGPQDPEVTRAMTPEESAEFNSGTVAYLEIRYEYCPPYVVQREIEIHETGEDGRRSRIKLLNRDSAWIRRGASKGRELRPEQHHLLVSHRDIPYIDSATWNAYVRHHPRYPPPLFHQPLSARMNVENQDALELLRSWLFIGREPVLLLHGTIGSGKSTLLGLFANMLLDELELASRLPDDTAIPDAWIPVLMPLAEKSFERVEDVGKAVVSALNLSGDLSKSLESTGLPPGWQQRILDSPDYSFALLLDGLDEMEDTASHPWTHSFEQLRAFSESHGNRIKVILTARSGTVPWARPPRGWSEISLLPLSLPQVLDSVNQIGDAILPEFLYANPAITEQMTCPLVLNAVLENEQQSYQRGLEPDAQLHVGLILHEIVTAILRHESSKDPSLSRHEARIQRRNALARLAWRLDGRSEVASLEVALKELGEQEVLRARQMGILRLVSDDYYSFTSQLLKAYFAAQHALGVALNAYLQGGSIDWAKELSHASRTAGFWELCRDILETIVIDDQLNEFLNPFYEFVGSCQQNVAH